MNRKIDYAATRALFWITFLAMIALALTISSVNVGAFISPVSPVKPTGLENCPSACVENYAQIEYPTCSSSCIEPGEVSPHYVTFCVLVKLGLAEITGDMKAMCGIEQHVSEWKLDEVWYKNESTACAMWTDGDRITRVDCP